MDGGLDGKHVLITGASGGIGFETARRFLQEGSRITAIYHTGKRSLASLENSYTDMLICVQADVRSEESVQAAFAEADRRFGRVDIAVANAGIANHEGVPIHEMDLDQWDNTLAVNLTGVFLTAKYFFQNLESHPEDTAALIMVGSTAGEFGEAWYCDYSASKAAMHGLKMSLKNEIVHLAPRGRVNLVNPGWTMTPMAEGALDDKRMLGRILQTVPLRKVAVPSDIAGVILYLASNKLAGHVSGQTITVAGGMEGRVLSDVDDNI